MNRASGPTCSGSILKTNFLSSTSTTALTSSTAVLLYVVPIIVILSELTLMIICIQRNTKPKGEATMETSHFKVRTICNKSLFFCFLWQCSSAHVILWNKSEQQTVPELTHPQNVMSVKDMLKKQTNSTKCQYMRRVGRWNDWYLRGGQIGIWKYTALLSCCLQVL